MYQANINTETIMKLTTQQILESIDSLQYIQKTNKPGTPKWENASKDLLMFFSEMALRYPQV